MALLGFEADASALGLQYSPRNARRLFGSANCHVSLALVWDMGSRSYITLLLSFEVIRVGDYCCFNQGLHHRLSSSSSWLLSVR